MQLPEMPRLGTTYDEQAFLLMDLQDRKIAELRQSSQIVEKAEIVVGSYLKRRQVEGATIRPVIFSRSTRYFNGDINSMAWGICFLTYSYRAIEDDTFVMPSTAQVTVAESFNGIVAPKNSYSLTKFTQEEAEIIYAAGQEIVQAKKQFPDICDELTMINMPQD